MCSNKLICNFSHNLMFFARSVERFNYTLRVKYDTTSSWSNSCETLHETSIFHHSSESAIALDS